MHDFTVNIQTVAKKLIFVTRDQVRSSDMIRRHG